MQGCLGLEWSLFVLTTARGATEVWCCKSCGVCGWWSKTFRSGCVLFLLFNFLLSRHRKVHAMYSMWFVHAMWMCWGVQNKCSSVWKSLAVQKTSTSVRTRDITVDCIIPGRTTNETAHTKSPELWCPSKQGGGTSS